jgi:hypothetical protein
VSRALLGLLVAVALAGCGGDQQGPAPAATPTVPGSIPFRVVEQASVSAAAPSRDEVRVRVAHSAKQWASLWREVTRDRSPTRPPPPIDFSREQILLVIAGPPATGISTTSISGAGGELRVAVGVTLPAPGCSSTAEVRSPYQFLALRDASDRTASVQISRQTDPCG